MAKKKTHIPENRRQYYTMPSMSKGLDLSIQKTDIGDNYVSNCNRVVFENDAVKKSPGFDIFGSSDVATPINCSLTVPLYRGTSLICRVTNGSGRTNLASTITVTS